MNGLLSTPYFWSSLTLKEPEITTEQEKSVTKDLPANELPKGTHTFTAPGRSKRFSQSAPLHFGTVHMVQLCLWARELYAHFACILEPQRTM